MAIYGNNCLITSILLLEALREEDLFDLDLPCFHRWTAFDEHTGNRLFPQQAKQRVETLAEGIAEVLLSIHHMYTCRVAWGCDPHRICTYMLGFGGLCYRCGPHGAGRKRDRDSVWHQACLSGERTTPRDPCRTGTGSSGECGHGDPV